jgi:hypothetical protein
VIKSQEQFGVRTRHDDGVAVAGRVRFDEGSDETENTRVPNLAAAVVVMVALLGGHCLQ